MSGPRKIGFLSFGAWHPGGGLTHTGSDAHRQTVALAVAADATLTSPPPYTALTSLLRGMPVKVATVPVRATLAAQRGDPNVLTAEHISIGS